MANEVIVVVMEIQIDVTAGGVGGGVAHDTAYAIRRYAGVWLVLLK